MPERDLRWTGWGPIASGSAALSARCENQQRNRCQEHESFHDYTPCKEQRPMFKRQAGTPRRHPQRLDASTYPLPLQADESRSANAESRESLL